MNNFCQNGADHDWRWWSKPKNERYCAVCKVRRTAVADDLSAGLHKKREFANYLVDMSDGRVDILARMMVRYHISLPTALNWRRRALSGCAQSGGEGRLKGRVEGDEAYFPDGEQGSRSLTRPARKRGSRRPRGLSKTQVGLFTAIERGGESRAVVLSGLPLVAAVEQTVAKGAQLITDGNRAYIAAAKKAKAKHHRLLRGRPGKGYRHLNTINGLHSALKSFVSRFNGIAGKSILLYFGWFQLLKTDRLKQLLLKEAFALGWTACPTCGK